MNVWMNELWKHHLYFYFSWSFLQFLFVALKALDFIFFSHTWRDPLILRKPGWGPSTPVAAMSFSVLSTYNNLNIKWLTTVVIFYWVPALAHVLKSSQPRNKGLCSLILWFFLALYYDLMSSVFPGSFKAKPQWPLLLTFSTFSDASRGLVIRKNETRNQEPRKEDQVGRGADRDISTVVGIYWVLTLS